MRKTVSIILGAIALAGLHGPANAAKDMDCANFGSQKAAQIFFLNNNPAADPHRLDSDGDWVVCESNPAPYYYGRDPSPDSNPAPAPAPVPIAQQPPAAPQPLKVVKVISGELVRVREGSRPSYVVHLMGTKVPKDRCKSQAALKDLRSWVKPGMVVEIDPDKRARDKDGQGNLWRDLTLVKGNYDIGGSQIATGFAKVDRGLRFAEKARYLRWEKKAKANLDGWYSQC